MTKTETVRCSRCGKDVTYHYHPVNHGKQLLLSVVTLGLWLPVWLCQAFCPTKLCDQCNGPIW